MAITAFAGSLTTAGALAVLRTAMLALAGTLTTAGSLTRSLARLMAGTLGTAGALSKRVALSFAGTLNTISSLVTSISVAGAAPGIARNSIAQKDRAISSVAGSTATSSHAGGRTTTVLDP
jgi:hypothetical protein